jgi:hypothetical protein
MKKYIITDYSKNRLQELNNALDTDKITIKPAEDITKKIDIFINNKKIATIGDNNYEDYPNYILKNGLEFANKRKELYYARHSKEADIKDNKITNSLWTRYLLW